MKTLRQIPAAEAMPPYSNDPRWQLVLRILASSQFDRAPLLSKFLLFVCQETLSNRSREISESRIGVRVFDRPKNYRTSGDNIVRNYARQLRKRLEMYFQNEGREEPLRLSIPLGGYIPEFSERKNDPATCQPAPGNPAHEPVSNIDLLPRQRPVLRYVVFFATLLLVFLVGRFAHMPLTPEPSRALWRTVFAKTQPTLIIPADSSLNIQEDVVGHHIPMSDYIKGQSQTEISARLDPQSASDLTSQRFTSFVDMQIVADFLQLNEYNKQYVTLRFPRDVTLDDLKTNNAIILGSINTNPLVEMFQGTMNFHIVSRYDQRRSWIENTVPESGEQKVWVSNWSAPEHTTYAIIALVPNLSGTGHILLLDGLDVSGTQAAAEELLRGNNLEPIFRKAETRFGELRPFEIVLESQSINSNSYRTRVIASRVH